MSGRKHIPDACPHCGTSSQGNWIRINGQFGCGSCNKPY